MGFPFLIPLVTGGSLPLSILEQENVSYLWQGIETVAVIMLMK
jgi:hypothetical protein